jgi:metal transporter CNNM
MTVLLLRRAAQALPAPILAASSTAMLEHGGAPLSASELACKLAVSLALVLLGGVFAGLTLGLMGLDEIHLRVLVASSDNERERADAEKGASHVQSVRNVLTEGRAVLQLLHKGRHWVLVVLLLSNVVSHTTSISVSPAHARGRSSTSLCPSSLTVPCVHTASPTRV